MKQSNQQKTNSGQRRYEKNKNRISDKPHMSKHERWEMMERLRIITEALSGNPKK
jgi:glycerol-3-phosphate cytidylyltransferase-like family protein